MKANAMTRKTRKPRTKKRTKYGLDSIPLNRGFKVAKYCFYQDIEPNDIEKLIKSWIKKTYSKADAHKILSAPAWQFTRFTHYAAAIYWDDNNLSFPEDCSMYMDRIKIFFDELLEQTNSESSDSESPFKTRRLSPRELLENKIQSTIMTDIDELQDDWMEGIKSEFDLFERFKIHNLKPAAVPSVKTRIETYLSELIDARDKTCDQAVEAYSHLKPMELKRQIKIWETAILDLERITTTSKIIRKSKKRVYKTKTAGHMVKGLKYLKESKTYKLSSINPESILGEIILFVFNEKTRAFTIYEAIDYSGFGIKGTTLTNFDSDKSFVTRLRKPEIFLQSAMTKSIKKVWKHFKELTTKKNPPTGRINGDTVILRTFKTK